MGRQAVDADPHRDDALGGDADVHVGRLAGDHEVAEKALGDEQVGASIGVLLGLLVGNHPEPHADALDLAQVGDREQHRGQGALHVVGAAAEKAIAVQPRLELLRAARDDVDVAVQQQRQLRVGGTDLGEGHGQAAALDLMGVDLACLQPALDEARALLDPLGRRGVVADQLLC